MVFSRAQLLDSVWARDADIDWHDGNLVDIHVAGLPGAKQTIRLFLDLYPDEEGVDRRRQQYATTQSVDPLTIVAGSGRSGSWI